MRNPGPQGPPAATAPLSMSAARAAVLETVRSRGTKCSVKEVADELSLHPNTVREHLDALLEQQLVVRESAPPTGRGRPALRYRATTDIGDVARDYELLADVLAEQVSLLPEPQEAARRAGRSWGRRLAPGSPEEGRETDRLLRWMDELGFQPTLLDERTLLLGGCPILAAARRQPGVVCQVHLGLAQAVVESQGGDGSQMSIHPLGHPNGCLLTLPEH